MFTVDGFVQTVSGQIVQGVTELLLNQLGIDPDFFSGDPCVNPNGIQSYRSNFSLYLAFKEVFNQKENHQMSFILLQLMGYRKENCKYLNLACIYKTSSAM